MNGDSQTILDAVKDNGKNIAKMFTQISTNAMKQDLQHKENKEAISSLKENVKRSDGHGGHIKAQWFIIGTILVGLIAMWVKG